MMLTSWVSFSKSLILLDWVSTWSFQRKEFFWLFEHLQAYFIKFFNNFTSTSISSFIIIIFRQFPEIPKVRFRSEKVFQSFQSFFHSKSNIVYTIWNRNGHKWLSFGFWIQKTDYRKFRPDFNYFSSFSRDFQLSALDLRDFWSLKLVKFQPLILSWKFQIFFKRYIMI